MADHLGLGSPKFDPSADVRGDPAVAPIFGDESSGQIDNMLESVLPTVDLNSFAR